MIPNAPRRHPLAVEVAALGGASLLLLLGMIWLVGLQGIAETPESAGSSLSSGPRGTLALYRWLESSGFEVSRVTGRDSFPPDADTLFMVNPSGDFPAGQAGSIRLWVEEGHTLILTLGRRLGDISAQMGEQHPILREFNLDFNFSGSYTATVPVAQPLFNSPPVSRVTMPGVFTLQLPPDAVALVSSRDDGGNRLPLAAMLAVGEGRVYILSTDYPMSNAGIREEDNGALIYNLARMSGGKRVAFDEAHHGAGSGGDIVALLTGNAWGWALIYAALLGAMYVVWSARRLGPPLPVYTPDQRRPTSDYVRSVARLFRRARKPDYAAGQYLHYFRRALSRHAALDPNLGDEEFVQSLSERGRFAFDIREMSEAVRELRDLEAGGSHVANEDDALQAIREGERVRKGALGVRE